MISRPIKNVQNALDFIQEFFEELNQDVYVFVWLDDSKQPYNFMIQTSEDLPMTQEEIEDFFESAPVHISNSILIYHRYAREKDISIPKDFITADQIYKWGKGLGIQVIDYLILNEDFYFSLAEENLLLK